MFTPTSTSTSLKSRPPSARTNSPFRFFLTASLQPGLAVFDCTILFYALPTKDWQGCTEGRRLGAMTGTNSSRVRSERNACMRVLGVDPAASGPTGYGIVESDGRQCHTLHYG